MNWPELIAKVPTEAWEGLGKTLLAIGSGEPDQAANAARVTAETVAAKLAIDLAYEAGLDVSEKPQ